MPANGRWDLILRLKVNVMLSVCFVLYVHSNLFSAALYYYVINLCRNYLNAGMYLLREDTNLQ